ncbi:MAG: hypothetical protein KDA86_17950 [Planctomycetaceae bacterium]|nr:hypothetical protein [Planctomycetaceae bacterium]
MIDRFDDELVRRLRDVGNKPEFDSQAFAARVVATRRRRRRQRVVAGGGIAMVLVIIGLMVQVRQLPEKSLLVVSDTPEAKGHETPVTSPDAPLLEQDLTIMVDDSLDQFTDDWLELQRLIDQTEERLAEVEKLRQERQLAFFRAEASKHIEIPDLSRFYRDETPQQIN